MQIKEAKEKIFAIVAENVTDNVEIDEDSDFYIDLGFDSLDMVDIVMKVEKTFGIDITRREESDLKTIKDLTTLVACKVMAEECENLKNKVTLFGMRLVEVEDTGPDACRKCALRDICLNNIKNYFPCQDENGNCPKRYEKVE